MKKPINIRNSVIVILCVTIITLAVGFIVLSIELETKKNQVFDISFKKIDKVTSIRGGNIEPIGDIKILSEGKILDMNFTLSNVHDELIYKATIKNEGTISARIIDILETPEYSKSLSTSIKPLSISYTDIEGKILEAGEETEIKISVVYNPTEKQGKKNISLKLGLITKSNNK